jgi:hypothetical protein
MDMYRPQTKRKTSRTRTRGFENYSVVKRLDTQDN